MGETIPAITVFLSNTSVAFGQTMDAEKLQSQGTAFENVELGNTGKKKKIPRRIIHFASGETMEEYSTDEDEEVQERKDLLPSVDPFDEFYKAVPEDFCDFLGEKMASLFGISTPKYQYAIDEYYRIKKEEEEEEKENSMSEEAERQYQDRVKKQQETSAAQTGQPETGTSFINVTFEAESEQTAAVDGNKQSSSPVLA
ncbi:protein FAM177A1 [Protopterus annectens]|uniref:protein FAM177A1 n=1 Tax=Protopterus annectens TaxID=7888 RepID=UPI001CF9FE12|nr:protein FAM177A1 [Protopterus annectens]